MNRNQQSDLSQCRIAYDAADEVRAVISTIGRTEDIKFSPDNSMLAIAAYIQNKIFFLSCKIDHATSTPKISLPNYAVFSSPHLIEPHGLAFLDSEHIVVCNRAADVCVFRVPAPCRNQQVADLSPVAVISGGGFLLPKVKSPGSVACRSLGNHCYQILVCNNFWNFVSSHLIRLEDPVRVANRGKLIGRGVLLPDGISLSPDGAWIAISNHIDGEVLIYKNSPELSATTGPACTLRGIVWAMSRRVLDLTA